MQVSTKHGTLLTEGFLLPNFPYIRSMRKPAIERFADFVGGAWFHCAYLVGTCWYALKGGWAKAKLESLPPQPTDTK